MAYSYEKRCNLNGQPAHSGYNCGGAPSGRNAASARNVVQVPNDNGGLKWANRADLIVSKKPPVEQDARGYLIADFKTSVNAISPYNDSNNQWRAMMNYAQHHQYVPVALFITLFGEEREGQEARRQKEALEHHGVFLRILSLFDKK